MVHGPLAGFKIGVTADRRADEQIRLLAGRGAECLHGPSITTVPVHCVETLGQATKALIDKPPEIIVLTTGIGVRGWLETADSLHLGEQLRSVFQDVELYARGAKATAALSSDGFNIATDAPLEQYTDVIDTLRNRGVHGSRIAVQLDGSGAEALCNAIEAEGAEIFTIPVYTWSLPEDCGPAERLIRAAVERRVDALTFTAKPAVENFFAIANGIGLRDGLLDVIGAGLVIAFCVGPVCASGIAGLTVSDPIIPNRFRLGAMVEQMSRYYNERAATIELAGTPVRVQGRLCVIDGGQEAWLAERERAVLDVLIDQPGTVHTKQELLRHVWGAAEHNEHLVEVTIGRLRQRLGPASAGIETVMRRGYRASAS